MTVGAGNRHVDRVGDRVGRGGSSRSVWNIAFLKDRPHKDIQMKSSPRFSMKQVAIFAIGLSAPAYALSAASSFNGYYGGATGGLLRTESKISASATSTFESRFDDDNQIAYSQNNIRIHHYTVTGAVYLGFGHFINDSKFYLAGEVFGDWAHRKNSLSNWVYHSQPHTGKDTESISATTTMKVQNGEYGLDIRPGYLMDTNTMAYLRVGVAFNELKNQTTNSFSFNDNRHIITPPSFSKLRVSTLNEYNRKTMAAFRLGVGLEHMITDTLSITADYIYTYYGKAGTSGSANTLSFGEDGDPAITNVNGLVADSSGRIGSTAGTLGIKYYFFPVC